MYMLIEKKTHIIQYWGFNEEFKIENKLGRIFFFYFSSAVKMHNIIEKKKWKLKSERKVENKSNCSGLKVVNFFSHSILFWTHFFVPTISIWKAILILRSSWCRSKRDNPTSLCVKVFQKVHRILQVVYYYSYLNCMVLLNPKACEHIISFD